MSTFQDLSHKITSASRIDFSDLFYDSVNVFKKIWLQGILFQVLNFALSLPLLMINSSIFGKQFFLENPNELLFNEFNNSDLIWDSASNLGVFFITLLITIILSTILSFGFFRVIRRIDYEGSFIVSDFFHFIKSERLLKAILIVLAYYGIAILATLMCVVPLFYAIIPLMFVVPMFAYNSELSISEVLKLAFQLGHNKWGITFIITLLNGVIIYILTLLTCGLGSLFLGAFLQMPIYIIYKNILDDF